MASKGCGKFGGREKIAAPNIALMNCIIRTTVMPPTKAFENS